MLPAASVALEKRAALLDETGREAWSSGTASCRALYYNFCQGWVWVWSYWRPGDRFGTAFSSCCPVGESAHQLKDMFLYASTGSPSGYGLTGTIDVWTADAHNCPSGAALRSTPMLPHAGWNSVDWSPPVDVSGGGFVITYTLASGTRSDPVGFVTDHPSAGPTGPAACGTCFPSTRITRSYYYGRGSDTYCPGIVLFDGVCEAELLMDCAMTCTPPVNVASRTWGQIKGLYR
jgi:hypothetical protein